MNIYIRFDWGVIKARLPDTAVHSHGFANITVTGQTASCSGEALRLLEGFPLSLGHHQIVEGDHHVHSILPALNVFTFFCFDLAPGVEGCRVPTYHQSNSYYRLVCWTDANGDLVGCFAFFQFRKRMCTYSL